ncbi:AbrB/MazE/SpoVT family DNA-binding domain-containing protein [Mesobacillus foraminis]|nr:AbrB/MazE/SpoVT family DNA-binding domain-containing protein [Mesobacillus foraminis]
MKSTGMVRRLDELGRVVIPKEIRKTFELRERDPMEIFVEENRIILQKYENLKTCAITGEISNENRRYGNGRIVLSPRGAEKLLRELVSVKLM